MGRASESANAVVSAVLEACQIYHVLAFRMQSGAMQIPVPGKPFITRPMRFGMPGMADVLATPRITIDAPLDSIVVAVTLWIECKAGSGRQSDEQKAFQALVESHGCYYLLVHDSADAVIKWLNDHRWKR